MFNWVRYGEAISGRAGFPVDVSDSVNNEQECNWGPYRGKPLAVPVPPC